MENQIVGLAKEVSADKEDSVAERKARLLRQAEFHRAGIVHSKASIKHGARPDVLFHSALDHASWAIRSRVDSILRPTGLNVASMAPYALTVLTFIRRRGWLKPALGVTAAAGALAWYVQKRRADNTIAEPAY
jgi:hypothetical protein